jgi:putative membrane protein
MAAVMTGGALMTLLLIGLTIWLIVRYTGPRDTAGGTAQARQILAERYARGDLDTDEYTHRRAELR